MYLSTKKVRVLNMSDIQYIMYYKKGCQKCRRTGILLKMPNSPQSCDIMKNEEALREAKSMGFSSLPVVKIIDNKGKVMDTWCDLNLDKIKYWNEKYSC